MEFNAPGTTIAALQASEMNSPLQASLYLLELDRIALKHHEAIPGHEKFVAQFQKQIAEREAKWGCCLTCTHRFICDPEVATYEESGDRIGCYQEEIKE